MGKNSQLHLILETEQLSKLKKQATELEITVSELIRRVLKGFNPSFNIIHYGTLKIELKKS